MTQEACEFLYVNEVSGNFNNVIFGTWERDKVKDINEKYVDYFGCQCCHSNLS